ncbi:MAG TPA: glutaredoxin family protein [Pyrinomonadaceae bacterium]|nr:glutaredoxin family protein [Pyrinomonadaceae bacterium]
MPEKVPVVLYTKPGCGLCEEMKHEMQRARIEDLYTLEEVNILDDAELLRRYRYDIPVLFIAGAEAFRHRLTAAEFHAHLTSLLRP